MIKTHSDDPNVALAAEHAGALIKETLSSLPAADGFDYGGHQLSIGEYEVCATCTKPIAEAQQASAALLSTSDTTEDPVVKEHLQLAAQLFKLESEAAIVRAELHNGHGTEPILNTLLGYQYERGIRDDYDHNHCKEAEA